MLKWALIFLALSVVAGLLGFGGVESVAASIATILFFLFVMACIIFFVLALFGGRVK